MKQSRYTQSYRAASVAVVTGTKVKQSPVGRDGSEHVKRTVFKIDVWWAETAELGGSIATQFSVATYTSPILHGDVQ